MDSIFLRTAFESGKRVFYPVDGQSFRHLPVQADRDKRDYYPVGTFFGTRQLIQEGSRYSATDIYPLDVADLMPSDSMSPAPDDMVVAWDAFKTKNRIAVSGAGESATRKKSGKKSLLEELLEKHPVPSIKKDGFWVSDENWGTLLLNIHTGTNTMLIGPAGTGKTELAVFLGKELGKDVKIYDMGSMHDPMSQLLGTHRLEKDGGATRSVFDYSTFVEDIQKPGIIVLDELSRATPMTNNILFPVLDFRRELCVEMAGDHDKRRIKVHDECVFIATANIGVEYTGTMSLDKALLSRMFPVELGFMPEATEVNFLAERAGIAMSDAGIIVNRVNKLRSMYRSGEVSAEVSVRDTLRCAQQVSFGRNIVDALKCAVLPMFGYDERDQVLRVFMAK